VKRLEGKVSIITGGGMGMGREASCLFASHGARVVLLDIDENAGGETVELITQAGGLATFVKGDVSDEAEVSACVAKAVEVYGRLDVLYANAGVLWKDRDKSVVETTLKNWDRVQAINLRGPFLLAKHGIPALEKSGGGSIILVGSISAIAGFSVPQDSYTAAKAGLIGLTKSLAVQFGPKGIRCNIIHPGMIDTPLQAPYLDETAKNEIAESLPVRRLGVARDIANAALFLASEESAFMTGAELVVDGGFYAM